MDSTLETLPHGPAWPPSCPQQLRRKRRSLGKGDENTNTAAMLLPFPAPLAAPPTGFLRNPGGWPPQGILGNRVKLPASSCHCHTFLVNYRSRCASFDFQTAPEATPESTCSPSRRFTIINGTPRNSGPRAAFGNYPATFIRHKTAEITCQKGFFLCARRKAASARSRS